MAHAFPGTRILLVGDSDTVTAKISQALLAAGSVVRVVIPEGGDSTVSWGDSSIERVVGTAREAWQAACNTALQELGGCDWLVHVAGDFQPLEGPLNAVSSLEADVRQNCLSGVYALECVLPGLMEQKSGRVIAITSLAAICPTPSTASYAASTMAWATYLESLRPPLKLRGILVNTLYTRLSDFRGDSSSTDPMTKELIAALAREEQEIYVPWRAALGPRLRRQLPALLRDCLAGQGPKTSKDPAV